MSKIVYHLVNPYEKSVTAHTATIFDPDEYQFNQIVCSLPAVALRVLFYALKNLRDDGTVELKPVVMARLIQTPSTFIALGVRTLIKYNIIQRQTRTTFWLSPRVAKPISVQIG